MKTKQKFVDELSGKEFDTEAQAVASETKHASIKKIFKDYQQKDPSGTWHYYQRDKQWLDDLAIYIIKAIKKHEPWIIKSFKDDGKELTKEYIGKYYVGRCLDDGNSPINHYHYMYMQTCGKCYKQYEQAYFGLHCCEEKPCGQYGCAANYKQENMKELKPK